MIDLESLDIVEASEKGFDIEYKNIKIKVLGQHSAQVRKADIIYFKNTETLRNKDLTDEEFAEGAEEYAIARAASRIGGWKGIKQEYSKELAVRLCTINPELRDLILREADKVENFTSGK